MGAAASALYTCTALSGLNKSGNLKPDGNGYYEVVLGALNIYNSAGAWYPLEPARRVIEESPDFLRRLRGGNLRGEYGHPKRFPNETTQQFMARVLQITEHMVAFHIAEVEINYKDVKGRNGESIIAIIGRIIPSGPHAATLERMLQNPKENVCFSIRCLTEDIPDGLTGRMNKNIREIITWDYVNEPGLAPANKYMFPALEEHTRFNQHQLLGAKKLLAMDGFGIESDQINMVDNVMNTFGWQTTKSGLVVPPSAQW